MCNKRGIELKLLFDNGNQHVGGGRAPDLGLHRVFARAEKGLIVDTHESIGTPVNAGFPANAA